MSITELVLFWLHTYTVAFFYAWFYSLHLKKKHGTETPGFYSIGWNSLFIALACTGVYHLIKTLIL